MLGRGSGGERCKREWNNGDGVLFSMTDYSGSEFMIKVMNLIIYGNENRGKESRKWGLIEAATSILNMRHPHPQLFLICGFCVCTSSVA